MGVLGFSLHTHFTGQAHTSGPRNCALCCACAFKCSRTPKPINTSGQATPASPQTTQYSSLCRQGCQQLTDPTHQGDADAAQQRSQPPLQTKPWCAAHNASHHSRLVSLQGCGHPPPPNKQTICSADTHVHPIVLIPHLFLCFLSLVIFLGFSSQFLPGPPHSNTGVRADTL